MSSVPEPAPKSEAARKLRPFRNAVLRGAATIMPPLLTVVLFLWAWSLIEDYVLRPVESGAQEVIVWWIWDARAASSDTGQDRVAGYQVLKSGEWIPAEIYGEVNFNPGLQQPQTAEAYYDRFVRIHYLRRSVVVPMFLAAFILVLYLLGKFLAAGVGSWIWNTFEGLIQRLPVVRRVYSSVKQVTDLVFSEQELQFSRVVAVEYPRKGTWALAFVVGEGLLDVRAAANEPVVTLLVPTSPMPATGFAVIVRKSETIDLNITLDQAIQFIVSCGVVVPRHQRYQDAGNGRGYPLPLNGIPPAEAVPMALPGPAPQAK